MAYSGSEFLKNQTKPKGWRCPLGSWHEKRPSEKGNRCARGKGVGFRSPLVLSKVLTFNALRGYGGVQAGHGKGWETSKEPA